MKPRAAVQALQVKPSTQTSFQPPILPSAARMLRRNVTHRGQHRLCSGCFRSRPWLLRSTALLAIRDSSEKLPYLFQSKTHRRERLKRFEMQLRSPPVIHQSPEESESQGSKVAMRPCLSSVARRRLKFSTLPSEPGRTKVSPVILNQSDQPWCPFAPNLSVCFSSTTTTSTTTTATTAIATTWSHCCSPAPSR